MRFNFDCRYCSKSVEAEWGWIGKTIDCAGCGKMILVPAPMEAAPTRKTTKVMPVSIDKFKFRCGECGRKYTTEPSFIGKKMRCSGCRAQFRIPNPGSVSDSADMPTTRGEIRTERYDGATTAEREEAARFSRLPKVLPPSEIDPETDSDFEPETEFDFDPDTPPAPIPQKTGSKHSRGLLDDDDFPAGISVSGGQGESAADGNTVFVETSDVPQIVALKSRSTWRKILDLVLGEPMEKMDAIEQQMADKAAAKLKDQRERERYVANVLANTYVGGGMLMRDNINILIASAVGMLVIFMICWWYSHYSFLIGVGLVMSGIYVYWNATDRFARVASEESPNHAAMCRLVPFYKWYYLATRWYEMKAHFVFICVGLMFIWQGVLLLFISPSPMKVFQQEKAASAPAEK